MTKPEKKAVLDRPRCSRCGHSVFLHNKAGCKHHPKFGCKTCGNGWR